LADEHRVCLFTKKVSKQPNGCWLWTAYTTDFGYGQFFDGERIVGAHVFSYRHFKGKIPDGFDLDHLCRVRNCVCPDHLEPVTRQVNLLRGETIPSRKAQQTHCEKGHEFLDSNIYRAKNGTRACRICRAERNRQWAANNRERRQEIDRNCYHRNKGVIK
jgi:hypothetical protein